MGRVVCGHGKEGVIYLPSPNRRNKDFLWQEMSTHSTIGKVLHTSVFLVQVQVGVLGGMMYIIDVSPENIRDIMEWYGESLSDLCGIGNYEDAFDAYVKARMPERYAQWVDAQAPHYPSVLFDWSNNLLEGLITEEEHNRILADFCNSAVRPNEHIQELLDGMK